MKKETKTLTEEIIEYIAKNPAKTGEELFDSFGSSGRSILSMLGRNGKLYRIKHGSTYVYFSSKKQAQEWVEEQEKEESPTKEKGLAREEQLIKRQIVLQQELNNIDEIFHIGKRIIEAEKAAKTMMKKIITMKNRREALLEDIEKQI